MYITLSILGQLFAAFVLFFMSGFMLGHMVAEQKYKQ